VTFHNNSYQSRKWVKPWEPALIYRFLFVSLSATIEQYRRFLYPKEPPNHQLLPSKHCLSLAVVHIMEWTFLGAAWRAPSTEYSKRLVQPGIEMIFRINIK
jgi:hypothetical protein